MKRIIISIIFIIAGLVGSACNIQPGAAVEDNPSPTAAAQPADIDETLLLWEGPALFAEDQTECHRLRLTADDRAMVARCAGEATEVDFVANQNGGWDEILSRFGPFEMETTDGRIDFRGMGDIGGPAWERAITVWAQYTYAELASGRISAAGHTVLAWNLGEYPLQPGQCQMLIVLLHGYATAGLVPCAGGQMQVIASNWLDTADWEQFDTWLYNRASYYQGNSYFDGRGTTEMSDSETIALAEWAKTVYTKLIQ